VACPQHARCGHRDRPRRRAAVRAHVRVVVQHTRDERKGTAPPALLARGAARARGAPRHRRCARGPWNHRGAGGDVRRSSGAALAHHAPHRGVGSRGRDARFDRRPSRRGKGEGRALRRVGPGDSSGLCGCADPAQTPRFCEQVVCPRRRRHCCHRRARVGKLCVLAGIDGTPRYAAGYAAAEYAGLFRRSPARRWPARRR
jgi:hypothetical protein